MGRFDLHAGVVVCVYSAGTYAMCVCSILLGVVIGGLREGDCDLLDELVDAAGALVGEHGVEGLGLALARAVLEVQALLIQYTGESIKCPRGTRAYPTNHH